MNNDNRSATALRFLFAPVPQTQSGWAIYQHVESVGPSNAASMRCGVASSQADRGGDIALRTQSVCAIYQYVESVGPSNAAAIGSGSHLATATRCWSIKDFIYPYWIRCRADPARRHGWQRTNYCQLLYWKPYNFFPSNKN